MFFQRGSGAEHPVAHSGAAETDYHRTAVLVVPSLAEPVRPGNVVRGTGEAAPPLTIARIFSSVSSPTPVSGRPEKRRFDRLVYCSVLLA